MPNRVNAVGLARHRTLFSLLSGSGKSAMTQCFRKQEPLSHHCLVRTCLCRGRVDGSGGERLLSTPFPFLPLRSLSPSQLLVPFLQRHSPSPLTKGDLLPSAAAATCPPRPRPCSPAKRRRVRRRRVGVDLHPLLLSLEAEELRPSRGWGIASLPLLRKGKEFVVPSTATRLPLLTPHSPAHSLPAFLLLSSFRT